MKAKPRERLEEAKFSEEQILDEYNLRINELLVNVKIIVREEKAVPLYLVSIFNISEYTKIVLEKIRQEFISKVDLTLLDELDEEGKKDMRKQLRREIEKLVKKYFPKVDESTHNMLVYYLLEESVGLGKLDLLLKDPNLEEIVVNNSKEPVWVYHRVYGWLETNIRILSEHRIRHYAMMIARQIGKEITDLNPLLDAHLLTGDRVNATLFPISTKGNTITIRKFATDPWTITKFIQSKTISVEAAALIWQAIQNELSIIIAGGTGSGKTSMLNVISNFFPPNQRIISIEDTRELQLPEILHWVPLATRLPNQEGKGGITMLDLLVNSLRMRPDRIVVGEIRRKEEAEVLLEAMHTGHSVYATLHANDARETIIRLTNPPIDIPKPMISAISFIVIQNRNRRTGKRRTFQIAEVLPTGDAKVVMQYDPIKDKLIKVSDFVEYYKKLKIYTGWSKDEVLQDLEGKKQVLKWLAKKNITDINQIGLVFLKYYTGKLKLD